MKSANIEIKTASSTVIPLNITYCIFKKLIKTYTTYPISCQAGNVEPTCLHTLNASSNLSSAK